MTVQGIELVYLYVDDLEGAIRFYEAALGLRFSRFEDWADCRLAGGTRFGLHGSHAGAEPQTPGTAIVDFLVDDLAAATERVRAVGATVGAVQEVPVGRFVEFRDPQGYRVQLFERARTDRPGPSP